MHGDRATWRELVFVGGGRYDLDNFVAYDAVTAMRIRGPIAQQVHDLPDGATIRLRTE